MGGFGAFVAACVSALGTTTPATAAGGDAQVFVKSLPSGGHSKTCDKPATSRVNSDRAEAVRFTFVNQKLKGGSWKTMRGYTQTYTGKPDRWISFKHVVFGGCGFGKGKYRLVVKAQAYFMTYANGAAEKHVVGRDSISRAYTVK